MFKNVEVEYYTNWDLGIEFKYFIDEYGVFWYNYEDICNLLDFEYDTRKANQILKEYVNENDKMMCGVKNYGNHYNENRNVNREFINTQAVNFLIERNNKRNSTILSAIHDLESMNLIKENVDYEEWEKRLDIMFEARMKKQYEELAFQIHQLDRMETTRCILDKAGVIDKEKEGMLDILHDEVYSYDPEYVEIKLAKRVKENEAESKTVPLSKSTCPEWLMDVVKNSK